MSAQSPDSGQLMATDFKDSMQELVEQVFHALTDEEVPLWFSHDRLDAAAGTPALLAQVLMRGDWDGSVQVICTDSAARALTRQLTSAEPGEPVAIEDVEDSMAEIANIFGGNVKSLLYGVSQLGLPTVNHCNVEALADQDDDSLLVAGCVVHWRDEQILVQVRRRTDD
ncbi:MAG: hypothetical protein CSA58_08700 [Micrococcales bacterium]|nr:MAG: hypothetical protein CSB46_04540 [Micrococcales bacterium]PIE26563.1 MAG: hypothetical protein CSA58_08700 [Micrococcales bacterium]